MIALVWVMVATLSSPSGEMVFELRSGESVKGQILSVYEKKYIIRSEGKDRLVPMEEILLMRNPSAPEPERSYPSPSPVFPRSRLTMIDFPMALERAIQPRFSSPQNTFKTWKGAAEQGNIDRIVECYAKSFQSMVKESLAAMTSEQIQAMTRETAATRFRMERLVYRGEMAFARVIRQVGKSQDLDILTFTKEDGDWKLIP